MRFLKSFKYAYRGIIYCINNERNMRIHTVAVVFVFAFSFFFDMSRAKYAVLFLTFASVVISELFNTVAEELSDLAAASFNPVVRIIKDMASGAVLVAAVFSVCVGVCLFWQPPAFYRIYRFFLLYPYLLAVFLLSLAAGIVYIVLGPIGIRDYIKRKKVEHRRKD